MKTINKEISDALHMLFHCSLKDTEYTTQREQFREVYNYIEKLEEENKKLKQPTIFIDTQDMEERYGEGLYMDYLKEENRQLKKKYENAVADYEYEKSKNQKAIEYIEYNDDTLFTYEPDYDYEENLVDNYDISSYREDLLEILKENNKDEK